MSLEVFHITDKSRIQEIESHWLKSLQQRLDDGTKDSKYIKSKLWFFKNSFDNEEEYKKYLKLRMNSIYFRFKKPPDNISWVSVILEKSEADVMNNRLEFQWYEKYLSSRMSLSDFLKNSEWCIDEDIYELHPITAKPIDKNYLEGDVIKAHKKYNQLYSPEIVVERNVIKDLVKINMWVFF